MAKSISKDNSVKTVVDALTARGIECPAIIRTRFTTTYKFNYCEACGDYLSEISITGACITASKSYLDLEQAIDIALGRKKCEIVWVAKSGSTDEGSYVCSRCNRELPESLQDAWDDYQAGYSEKPFNNCLYCGAEVNTSADLHTKGENVE